MADNLLDNSTLKIARRKPVNAQKKRQRFLKSIARQAAAELDQLRDISPALAALDFFFDVMTAVFVENNPIRVLDPDAQKKKMIGVYCMVVPEELIYASGAVPVRLCAGCFEPCQLGEDRVPRDGCPLVKSAMGLSIQNGLTVFDACDAVIVPTTCDPKRKLGEELSAFKDVWMLEMPHIKEARFSRRIWMEQMYALKNQLERFTRNGQIGNKIKARQLTPAIAKSAAAQFQLRRLQSFRKAEHPVIWGRQAVTVLNAYAYAPVDHWTRSVVQLNDQLEKKVQKGETVCAPDRPRIMIAGSPVIFPNLKIFSLVEEMGGIVVCDESCAGDRYLYDPVGYTEKNLRDQMSAIGSRYMAPCVCPSFAPNDDRLILIKRTVQAYAVDGLLYHVLKGCLIYDFEVHRVETMLKPLGIPLLRIETDYNPEDIEQLRTRIEAFIEMLKSKAARRN